MSSMIGSGAAKNTSGTFGISAVSETGDVLPQPSMENGTKPAFVATFVSARRRSRAARSANLIGAHAQPRGSSFGRISSGHQ